MERTLVQILVVVANIQMRTLKAEVEKGSARTAFVRRLVDPKAHPNGVVNVFALVEGRAGLSGTVLLACARRRKGIRRKFLNQDVDTRVVLRCRLGEW